VALRSFHRLAAAVTGTNHESALDRRWLFEPDRLWSWGELAESPSLPPRKPGVYGWYFDQLPPAVPVSTCRRAAGCVLAYVGIAPKSPPSNGAKPSTQTLRDRLRYHFTGNAEGSTLRLTLGCLLAAELGLELRRVGSGKRLTFHTGEIVLSGWMAQHGRVVWSEHPEPWLAEAGLMRDVSLPLNLAGNQHSPFHTQLSELRATQKGRARMLPIAP
jgi:GIY-YIG catalytic domain-containing protein